MLENIEHIKCCDLFSHKCEKTKKQYILLSFFGKKTNKLNRSKQYCKKLFTFNDCSIDYISEKLNEFFLSIDKLIEIKTLDKSFSSKISKKIKHKKSNNSLSISNNKKGVNYLISKIEEQESEIYIDKELSIFINCNKEEDKENTYVFEIKDNEKTIKKESGFKLFADSLLIDFFIEEILEVYSLSEYKSFKLNISSNVENFEKNLKMRLLNRIAKKINTRKEKTSKVVLEELKIQHVFLREKITEYKNEITNKENYNILYTDGSSLIEKENKYISGAFILSTDRGYLHGGKVKKLNFKDKKGTNEAEYLALYLGLKEVTEKNITNKKLSIIVDSDYVIEFLIKTKKRKEVCIFNTMLEVEIAKLLKLIDFDFEAISIKSHKKNTNNDIYKHNKAVDLLAYNVIIDKINNEQNLMLDRKS